jgi:hypothetical protein
MKIEELIEKLTKIAEKRPNVEVKMSYLDMVTRIPEGWATEDRAHPPSFIRDFRIDEGPLYVEKCKDCNFEAKSTDMDCAATLAEHIFGAHIRETGHKYVGSAEEDCILLEEIYEKNWEQINGE